MNLRGAMLALLCGVTSGAFATDYTWTGAKSNVLDDGENWSGGIVPGSADKGTITVSGDEPVTFTLQTDTFAPKTLNVKPDTGSTAPVIFDFAKHTMTQSGDFLNVTVRSFTITNGVWTGDGLKGKTSWGAGNETDTYEFNIVDAEYNPHWGDWAWVNKAYAGGTLRVRNSKSNYVPIFQRNLTLICDNSCVRGMVPSNPAAGTNFFWHVTNHSIVTNSIFSGKYCCSHVVVDGDSAIDYDDGLNIGASNSVAHDNILAVSNSMVHVNDITVAGTNDTAYFHNVDFISRATWRELRLYGVGNKVYFSGTQPMYNARKTYPGLGTHFEIGEGCVLTNGEMKLSAAKDVTLKVGKDARFRGSTLETKNGDAVLSGSKFLVEKGAQVSLDQFNGNYGLNGSNNVISIRGSVKVDKIAELGMYGPVSGCRLELIGDEAEFISGVNVGGSSGYLRLGSTDCPNALTLKFQPGPTGFGGVAPLRPFDTYVLRACTLNDAIIEVDAREYYAALPAQKEAYRLPLIFGGYSLTVADFDSIKAKAVLKPAGELVLEEKTLYYEFYKKPGLLILVR